MHFLKTETFKILLRNLAKLILIVYPIFYVLVWIQALINKTPGSNEILYSIETGAFYYFGSILYIILSGLIYNAFLLIILRYKTVFNPRIIAVMLTVLIPITLILLTENIDTIVDFIFPSMIAMIIYGTLVKIPNEKLETSN